MRQQIQRHSQPATIPCLTNRSRESNLRSLSEIAFRSVPAMQQIDCIRFVDEATGCGVTVSVYRREDAMVLVDVQLPDKPATVVSLPSAEAKRLADAVIWAIS